MSASSVSFGYNGAIMSDRSIHENGGEPVLCDGSGVAVLVQEPASDAFHGNEDLAPTTPEQRRWGMKDIAALWVSMSACIPTYMLASSLIAEGMNWWQAVLTIFLGNTIVLLPMVLNAHAGTRYGIPFPIYCRAAVGGRGANVPALLRGLVGGGWCGIQA